MRIELHTPICDLLKIRYPIFQAAMAGISCPELVAAVSEAGGFGTLAASGMSGDSLRNEIRRTRALTKKAFGVNIIVPFLDEEHLYVCFEEKISVISFHWGFPESVISDIHASGAKIFMQICSVQEAVRAAEAGVDCIIAQGSEAGGHCATTVGNMCFLPQVVDAVGKIPVLAAGGIGNSRGVAASLALGAQGVWVGTRFIASVECSAHDTYKEKILSASLEDTVRSTVFDYPWRNALHRALLTAEIAEWKDHDKRPKDWDQVIGHTQISGDEYQVKRFSCLPPSRQTTGDIEKMVMYAGQGCGMVKEIKSVSDIMKDLTIGLED